MTGSSLAWMEGSLQVARHTWPTYVNTNHTPVHSALQMLEVLQPKWYAYMICHHASTPGLHEMPRSLQWCHNEREGISNHQPHHCLLNRLFRSRSKKTPKLRVTGLCAGNSPVTGEFPTQRASNVENVSIWWCHHVMYIIAHTICSFFFFSMFTLTMDPCNLFIHIHTFFNSLWLSDATWHQVSWSTLVPAMACCLMVPSAWGHQAVSWTSVDLPSMRSSGIHSKVMFSWTSYHSPCCVWNLHILNHSHISHQTISWLVQREVHDCLMASAIAQKMLWLISKLTGAKPQHTSEGCLQIMDK